MKDFADLWVALDTTTKTNLKVAAMKDYFLRADPASAAWAVWFLSGRKPRSAVTTKQMRMWVTESLGLSDWLFQECYDAVGDLAETFTLLLPASDDPVERSLADWVENHLLPLRGMEQDRQKAAVFRAWGELDTRQGFIWNKLITGGFRVGVSQSLVTRALAQASGIPAEVVAHRLMGEWSPTPGFYTRLLSKDTGDADASQPYPFCLAHPLEAEVETLGDVSEWFAEWKWDGIRSQLIRRSSRVFLWSRGEELVTDRYPELEALGEAIPDGTVLDAEILPWFDGRVQPFALLQKRIGRKVVGKKLLEEIPVVLMAYDLLELAGVDLRNRPLIERRIALANLVAELETRPANSLFALPGKASAVPSSPAKTLPLPLRLSPEVPATSWEDLSRERDQSRFRSVEGLMLKRRTSTYRVGRVRGDWWKWKVQPFTFDGVLIYAQRGSGRRASLYSDYTFGVWDGDRLVPIAKAYSGLTDEEMKRVDAFVRKNTLETFGPVRTVEPELVMELGFEGIARSTRHKSGIAVRFPRILRWRTDKTMQDADRLENIEAMLPKAGGPESENRAGSVPESE